MSLNSVVRRAGSRPFKLAVGAVTAAGMIAWPHLVGSYGTFLVSIIAVTFIGASALTMLMGHAHQFHLGFAGVFAVGAYTSLVSQTLGWGWASSLLLAAVAATILSAGLGYLARYFGQFAVAIVTFGFGIFALQAVRHFDELTGGNVGLPAPLVNSTVMYYTIIVVAALTALVLGAALRAWSGRAFRALRDGVVAAELLGLNIPRTKTYAFTLSGPFVGFAGGMYAHLLGYVSPNTFNIELSLAYVMIIIIGGSTSLLGALVGATVWVIVPELAADVPGLSRIAIGLLAIVTLLWAPDGAVGVGKRLLAAVIERIPGRARARYETVPADARQGRGGVD